MNSKKIIIILCCFVAILVIFISVNAEAKAKKATYKYKTMDATTQYSYGKATVYQRYVVIDGNSKGVKAVNADIVKTASKFVNDKQRNENLKEYLRSNRDAKNEFYNFVKAKVTYNKNNIISIKYSQEWFAGGVHNLWDYGETYNLKTGKKLTLQNVAKKGAGKKVLKEDIYNKLNKSSSYLADNFNQNYKLNIKKQNYYLTKKGNIAVCFEPYAIGTGASGMNVAIKGRYSK